MENIKNSFAMKPLLWYFLGGVFIIYTDLLCIPWQMEQMEPCEYPQYFTILFLRYLFFVGLIAGLVHYNIGKGLNMTPQKRLFRNFLVCAAAYIVYFVAVYSYQQNVHGLGVIIFSFFALCITCTLVGHVAKLYYEGSQREIEISRLRSESLQSRCDALANQINPHFFFNSLNSLAALVRRGDERVTLDFIDKLSDVFRYILQSDRKGLVTLDEELAFVDSFKYMMEVRFANKLRFSIEVEPADRNRLLPVLSLLPLIDNIVVHNTIDSEHLMAVSIRMNEKKELTISNPVYPKLMPSRTNGTGLQNLKNRFRLLCGKEVRVENTGKQFTVFLPL